MKEGSDDEVRKGPDWEILVKGVEDGDLECEQRLAGHLRRRVLQKLLYETGYDEALAEDLAQDTVLIVLVKLRNRELRIRSRVVAFALQTAHNKFIANVRTHKRRATYADSELIDGMEDGRMSPEDHLDREQLMRAVDKLLKELNKSRDQEVLRRFYLLEQSKREICRAMELSSSVFDNVLYRAKGRLRKALEDDDFDPEGPSGVPA